MWIFTLCCYNTFGLKVLNDDNDDLNATFVVVLSYFLNTGWRKSKFPNNCVPEQFPRLRKRSERISLCRSGDFHEKRCFSVWNSDEKLAFNISVFIFVMIFSVIAYDLLVCSFAINSGDFHSKTGQYYKSIVIWISFDLFYSAIVQRALNRKLGTSKTTTTQAHFGFISNQHVS